MHYIPKGFFIASNEKAHISTNHLAKKTPKRRKLFKSKVVQW